MTDIRVSAMNTISSVDEWLKVLAGNLTGSNVTGYRQQRVQFEDVLTEHVSAGSPATSGGGSTIDPVDISVGGAQLKATKTDFSQGSMQSTNVPTDLGITGDGFFVLSRTKEPKSLHDLVFTRNGSFHFDYFQKPGQPPGGGDGSSMGEYRLVNQDGLFVMGFRSTDPSSYKPNATLNLPGSPVPPKEMGFSDGTPLATAGIFGSGFSLKPIVVPFQNDPNPVSAVGKNLNPNFTPKFDSNGWVQSNSDAPMGDPDHPNQSTTHLVQFVALAKFADPAGLKKLEGGSQFGWDPIVGSYFLGAAGFAGDVGANAKDPRPVGSTNTINAGALEASNSSVNTTLPELTIAQKSFSADVKIVQVGNSLIDDVNNLVR